MYYIITHNKLLLLLELIKICIKNKIAVYFIFNINVFCTSDWRFYRRYFQHNVHRVFKTNISIHMFVCFEVDSITGIPWKLKKKLFLNHRVIFTHRIDTWRHDRKLNTCKIHLNIRNVTSWNPTICIQITNGTPFKININRKL